MTKYVTSRGRRQVPLGLRQHILERDIGLCQYCHEDRATDIDHIIPWAYGGGHTEDNLVASCRLCNLVASDMVFDSFEQKKEFINQKIDAYLLHKSRQMRRKLSVCSDCDEIFMPNVVGATVVLCGPCNRRDLNSTNLRSRTTKSERKREIAAINRALKG